MTIGIGNEWDPGDPPESNKKSRPKPKFKIGQVVSVKSFYGNFLPGETGPGFTGKRGWRHGFIFGKIVKIHPRQSPPQKSTARHCYVLDGWISAQTEDDLRSLTTREASR